MGCVFSHKGHRAAELYTDGPDQIVPVSAASSSSPACACNPSKTADVIQERPGTVDHTISLPGRFMLAARLSPDKRVMAYKERRPCGNLLYKFVTMSDYLEKTRAAAKAFIELGLERHGTVIIIAQSCPQWNIAFFAAIFAGGIGGGMSITSSAEECEAWCYAIRPQILVVQDAQQADKILGFRHHLATLKAIIQLDGSPKCTDILTWSELIRIGFCMPDKALEHRLKRVAINHCCTVLLTDGNGAEPKMVQLRHDTVNSHVSRIHRIMKCFKNDRLLTLLPQQFVTAHQMFNAMAPICCDPYIAFFSGSDTPNLTYTFREVRPTILVTVAQMAGRVAALIKQVYQDAAEDSVHQWALSVVQDNFEPIVSKKRYDEIAEVVARHLVFSKVKIALGLGNLNVCLVLDGPLDNEVKKWWMAADLNITAVNLSI